MKKLFGKKCPLFALISLLISFVGVVVVVALVLSQIFAKVEHEKKWSDYDECGIF